MFEYFVFVMNKKIKKRKNVLKNVSSLLQNKRKIFLLYLLSMASRHQIQQKSIPLGFQKSNIHGREI